MLATRAPRLFQPCRRRCRATLACRSASVDASTHTLPDGTPLELVSSRGDASSKRPPLLFIHGSGHAAWCYREHFLPALAARGWDCHALSLRGRGASGAPPPGARAGGTLATHAADVADVAKRALARTPIIIGHSFGGLVVQRLVLDAQELLPETQLPGVALLASAPPSGNSAMVARIARDRGLLFSAKLTWYFITRAYSKNPDAARTMFFSDALPDTELRRYVALLAANDGETPVLDVRKLGEETPLPALEAGAAPPGLVIGGDADTIVDVAALHEAAAWLGCEPPVVLPGMGHDVMLDVGWEGAAATLDEWGWGVCGGSG